MEMLASRVILDIRVAPVHQEVMEMREQEVDMNFEYHKSKLSSKCQKLYQQMYIIFSALRPQVGCKGYLPNEINNVYTAVMDDHPELFYMSYAPRIEQKFSFFGSEISLSMSNTYPNNEIQQMRLKIHQILDSIERAVSTFTDDESKERYVCEYLLSRVTYEINNTYNQNAASPLFPIG